MDEISLSHTQALPRYVFNAWRLDVETRHEIDERQEEFAEWSPYSLAEELLRYQLEYSGTPRQADNRSIPSLTSLAIRQILRCFPIFEDAKNNMSIVAAFIDNPLLMKRISNAAQLPYQFLRFLLALPELCDDYGPLIDLDEAVLRNERYLQEETSSFPGEHYLLTLDDFLTIVSPITQITLESKEITFARELPPKGDIELLDELRQRELTIQGSNIAFVKVFKRITGNLLDGLDWNNVLIAGGMVLTTSLHTDLSQDRASHILHPEIDIYLYGLDPEKANLKVVEIHNVWHRNLPTTNQQRLVVKTAETIELLADYPVRRIQIILELAYDPLRVLLKFDLDSCALGFDGFKVTMLPRCARALETGYNVFTMDLVWGHNPGRRRESRIHRILKYANRGFGASGFVFSHPTLNLCKRISPALGYGLSETEAIKIESDNQIRTSQA